jgi:hypothetical protein
MLTNQQKGNKTMKTLTQSAQVNKLLKAKAKQLNLNVTGHSKNFSMGCSVTIKVLNGSDEALNQLKEYSYQFEYGKFDGMTDMYEITNNRDDIPQTKYLFINDDRATVIMQSYDQNIFRSEKKWLWFDNELRWYEWLKQIKQEYQTNWQDGLKQVMEGKVSKYKILNA